MTARGHHEGHDGVSQPAPCLWPLCFWKAHPCSRTHERSLGVRPPNACLHCGDSCQRSIEVREIPNNHRRRRTSMVIGQRAVALCILGIAALEDDSPFSIFFRRAPGGALNPFQCRCRRLDRHELSLRCRALPSGRCPIPGLPSRSKRRYSASLALSRCRHHPQFRHPLRGVTALPHSAAILDAIPWAQP